MPHRQRISLPALACYPQCVGHSWLDSLARMCLCDRWMNEWMNGRMGCLPLHSYNGAVSKIKMCEDKKVIN